MKESRHKNSTSHVQLKKPTKVTKKLKQAESHEPKQFFFSRYNEKRNEDMSLPEAISRLYVMNVEAAQNQMGLKEQILTTALLNKNFGRSFKRNAVNVKDFDGKIGVS
jgi:hypothetical protein